VKGKGKLKSANEVEVALNEGGSKVLKAKNILIATGSEVTPMPNINVKSIVIGLTFRLMKQRLFLQLVHFLCVKFPKRWL
jgi:pyruvate/2-oxoglutarate dehydrogenase complex dihydrolipoamide dehydrogenase (E3) component